MITEEVSVSNTFNIGDLKPYIEPTELRTILPQEGGIEPSMQGTHGSSMTLEEDKYEDEAIQTFIQTEGCTDSSTEDQQSCQPPPADQHTLQLLHRTNRNIPGDTKGSFGISIHGPCFHGPRNLLTIMGRLQETVQKVGCSTELLSESNTCLADQHTLQTSSRANVYLFGDIKSSYGISTHGPYDHG